MVKKRLRTFQVREGFRDPYIDQVYSPGEDVEEADLLEAGWKPSDIERATGNLLIPHLLPQQVKPKESDDGQSNGA